MRQVLTEHNQLTSFLKRQCWMNSIPTVLLKTQQKEEDHKSEVEYTLTSAIIFGEDYDPEMKFCVNL